jgi:small conductance mechanosensitive channel
MVVNALGVETSAFVAVIGAAGLAIGLSLQGSLSNFAGGILIILFKPFRVGDFIEVQGEGGTVTEIQILYTRMLTPNNQVVYIPNGALSNGNIKNYSKEPIRKAELIIGVAYNSDIKHVKSVLARIIEMDKTILADPAPVIRIKDLADSSVNFQVFVWATNADFWQMLSDFKENTKIEFDKEGIEIPFPQRDINVRALPDKDNSVL